MQNKQKNNSQGASQGGRSNNRVSTSFRDARQRLGRELELLRQRTTHNTQRYTSGLARQQTNGTLLAPVKPLTGENEAVKRSGITDLQTFEDQKTLTGQLRPPENLAGLGLATPNNGDAPTTTFHTGQISSYLKNKNYPGQISDGKTATVPDSTEQTTVAYRPSYDEPTNKYAANSDFATRPMSPLDVQPSPHASFLAGFDYAPIPVPKSRASLPVVSANAVKQKKLRRRFNFIAPPERGPQLFSALMSAIVVLILLIFTLLYLRSFLDRASADKFSVVFADLGEGNAFAHTATAKNFGQHLGYNYQHSSNIPNADMRIDDNVLTSPDQAATTLRQYNSDITVWGEYDQPTNHLWLQLQMQPNGPLDAYDWNYVSSQLVQLNTMAYTMTVPTDWTQPTSFSQLLNGFYHYYNGEYDQAITAFSTLLEHTPTATANELYLRFLRGNVFFAQGNYQAAQTDFDRSATVQQLLQNNKSASPLNLPLSWILNNQGATLLARNNANQAMIDFRQAIDADNTLAVAYLNLARLQTPPANQQIDVNTKATIDSQIETNLTSAVNQGQGEVKAAAYVQRSQLYYQQNKLDVATSDAQQAIAIDPTLALAYNQLGQVYLQSYLSSDKPQNHQDLLNKAYDAFQKGVDVANSQHDQNYDNFSNLCNDRPTAANSDQASVSNAACNHAKQLQTQQDDLNYQLARATFEKGLLQGTNQGNVFAQLGRAISGQKLWIQQARDRFLTVTQTQPNLAAGFYYLARTEYITNAGDWEVAFNDAIRLAPSQFQYYKTLADIYVQQNDLDKAIGKYQEYLKFGPTNSAAHLNLASLYFQQQKYALAAAQADQAAKTDPGNYQAHLIAGEAYARLKNYASAVQNLQAAVSLDSTEAQSHYDLGMVYDNAGQIDNAIDQLQVAINFANKADPTMLASAYYQRALLLEQKGSYQQAADDYQQATNYDNQNADAFLHLGDMYSKLNQKDKAAKAYTAAAKLKNGGLAAAIANYKLGLTQENQGQYAPAVNSFNTALGLWPTMNEALLERGKAELAQAQFDNAIATINSYLGKISNNVVAYNTLGEAQRDKGDFNAALASYNKAVSLQPQSAEAHLGLAICEDKLGNYNNAMSEVTKALQINPNYSDTFYEQGNILLAQGQSTQAFDSYEKAAQANPNNSAAYSQIGNVYLSRGQTQAAIDSYNRSIQLNPNDANAHYQLAMISSTRNEFDAAIPQMETAVKVQNNWPDAWYQLGKLYEEKARESDAEKAFRNAIQQQPTFIAAHYELGNVLLTETNRDGALSEYQVAIKQAQAQHIDFLPAWFQEGSVYESEGKLDQARQAYTQVVNTAKASDAELKQQAQESLNRINGQ